MNIAKLQTSAAANEGRPLIVLHPDDRVPLLHGEGDSAVAVSITLRGQDSDAFIKAERDARTRNVENLKERVKYSAAEDDHLAAETLARCTVGWQGIPQGLIDGSESAELAPFSYDNALKLYQNMGARWLYIQVDKFVGARANFLKA